MSDKKEPQSYSKSKSKPGAILGFRTSSFIKNQNFKGGGARTGFNPSTFKTQHKG